MMCSLDRTATSQTIIYQILVVIFVVTTLIVLSKYNKNILKHFFIASVATIIYDFFTAPLKFNLHLGQWGYIYHTVSWVFPLGFATMVILSAFLVDKYFSKSKELVKFAISLSLLVLFSLLVEKFIVVPLGIRSFPPETISAFSSDRIKFLWNTPLLEILYLPVYLSLVLAFYKYFSLEVDNKLIVPVKKAKLLRNFFITFIGVLLFELTVGSMVNNKNFPEWSYIFKDITLILTISWTILVWSITHIIDKILINDNIYERFFAYLTVITVLTTPAEAWLMQNGFREYSKTAVENFSGYIIPLMNIPVEVVFGVPFYFALVIGFVKYITYCLDNKNEKY